MRYAIEEVGRRYTPGFWHVPTNGDKDMGNGYSIFDELWQYGKAERLIITCADHNGRVVGSKHYFRYEVPEMR